MMVTAGLRESERSKANRRKPDTQVIEGSVISENDIQKYIYSIFSAFGSISGVDRFVLFQTKQGKKSLQEPWRIDDDQSDLTNKTSSTEIQLIATTET